MCRVVLWMFNFVFCNNELSASIYLGTLWDSLLRSLTAVLLSEHVMVQDSLPAAGKSERFMACM